MRIWLNTSILELILENGINQIRPDSYVMFISTKVTKQLCSLTLVGFVVRENFYA